MNEPQTAIRLIAIDIDGTLLNPQRQITPRTKEAIQAAQDAGIVVTLATGRRYASSRQFADELGIQTPLITYDGALITHQPDGEILSTNPMAVKIAQQTVEIFTRHHIQPIVQHVIDGQERTWSGFSEYDTPETQAYLSFYPQVDRLPYEELCLNQPDPLRVVAFTDEASIIGMLAEISALDCAWDMLKKGNYGCAELSVMHETCSKASAVRTLAQHLHFELGEVMAIGDNTNDIQMLQEVGWGVAMGQAHERIQALAHAITGSNAEDGVAEAIERYALGDKKAASNSRKR